MGLGQLVHGVLSDRYGRRGPLFGGLALFTLASIGAALAQDVGALAWLRFAQGLGGCAGTVISRAIARDLTEGPSMVRTMSRLMLVMGIAPIIAPSIGGALLVVAGWRAIFWALAAYGAVLVLAVAWGLPESLPKERRRRDGPLAVLRVFAALVADRRYLGHALATSLSIAGMFAYIAGSPFVFMTLNGVSPEAYGLFFGLNAFGIMLAAQVNARIAHRVRPERALAGAQAIQATAGGLLLLAALTGLGGFPAIVLLLLVYVGCIGAVMPLGTALAMAAHGRVAGSASALIGTLQFGLGAVAAWLVGVLQGGASAVPMALTIALCGAAAVLARVGLVR
jgi:DHA1 family bicyclomycin/chloramphenicol resistance-like MFS transporter